MKKVIFVLCILVCAVAAADNVKEPNVAGQFYPESRAELAKKIDSMLEDAAPGDFKGEIFALISPHAGYDFSGRTAAFGYKLIKGKPYKTVVVIAPSHQYGFYGVSVYPSGIFCTPLGNIPVDADFCQKIMDEKSGIYFVKEAFSREHSLEVQLPFLQRTLEDFKIVPVIIGDCSLKILEEFSSKLVKAIGQRKDVLLIASTDLCHSYDYSRTEAVDKITIACLSKMSANELYSQLKSGSVEMCGGFPVVATILTAKSLGHDKIKILGHTDSSEVTGQKIKGLWTVGYLSAVIDKDKESPSSLNAIAGGSGQFLKQKYSTGKIESEVNMLNDKQKKRLLEIARKTIEEYVVTGKRQEFKEDDPKLKEVCGAFVTLHEKSELRGCIGSVIGQEPLYLTVRDMAIQSAVCDPRFTPVKKNELKDIEIEISVLSPLKKINDISEFKLGVNGALIKNGPNVGLFLPQVATETGWTKEEFLSNLCAHKACLPADAWKDSATEIYIFDATVFSEKQFK